MITHKHKKEKIENKIKFKRYWVEQVLRDKHCRHRRRLSQVATVARRRVSRGPSVETRRMDRGAVGVLKEWWATEGHVNQEERAR